MFVVAASWSFVVGDVRVVNEGMSKPAMGRDSQPVKGTIRSRLLLQLLVVVVVLD
jgi:hypothetical protein